MSVAKAASRRPKILLVDDETAILHALGLFLEIEGYEVEGLIKFDNYLKQLKKANVPDLIILDILLNGEDGVKIAKELKASNITKDIPIVMISALPDGKKQSEIAGVDAFLAKPFDVKDLNKILKGFIGQPLG